MKQQRPKFYAFYKNFSNGKIETIDVLNGIFNEILTLKGTIKKRNFCFYDKDKFAFLPVKTKKQLKMYVSSNLMYRFWSKCEWEFVAIDWPHLDMVKDSRPVKIDVYDQLKPNIDLIVDLVWNYIEPKINKNNEK